MNDTLTQRSEIKTPINKRNLLSELYNKKITAKEAQQIFDQVLRSEDPGVFERLAFSASEYTAYIIGSITLTKIAKWRYEGWPDKCALCGKKIYVERGGWLAIKKEEFNEIRVKNVLVHLDCYNKLLVQRKPELADE